MASRRGDNHYHPDVVSVAFDAILGERPNQIRRRDDVALTPAGLLDAASTPRRRR